MASLALHSNAYAAIELDIERTPLMTESDEVEPQSADAESASGQIEPELTHWDHGEINCGARSVQDRQSDNPGTDVCMAAVPVS
ncbi:hypothetical protein [Mycolicibacter minnesotensis]|uniref:hypothetical protein n=1 Tax=Mycolicibacter minnesotensis TaxID=1118379 RepID=UPI0010566A04|nr:hypothetical protein [Mycolicibacter minnesotensis]